MIYGVLAAMQSIELARLEQERERAFYAHVETLPPEMRYDAVRRYTEAKEKARLESIAERRHQELCEAIRSTRPKGLGIFW